MAVLGTAESDLDEVGSVASVGPAAAASGLVDHRDSLVAAAFAGSAFRLGDCRPSCSQQQEVVVQGREAGFVRAHPIGDLADLLWYQQVDTPEGERLAAAVRQLDLAVHW